jgi:hypothetical protein
MISQEQCSAKPVLISRLSAVLKPMSFSEDSPRPGDLLMKPVLEAYDKYVLNMYKGKPSF